MKFGAWIPLAEAVAPPGPGVLQARCDQIFDYPKGKSAMVRYDADEELGRALARLRAEPSGATLVRFASIDDPRPRLERLVREFEDRFGSKPRSARGEPARR